MMRGRRHRAMSFFFSLSVIKRETDDTLTDGTTNSERERGEREKEKAPCCDASICTIRHITFLPSSIDIRF